MCTMNLAYIAPFLLFIHFPTDVLCSNVTIIGNVCVQANDTCVTNPASVCDTATNTCRYKANSNCSAGVDRCVSGATCLNINASCSCNSAAYTANSTTGLCDAMAKKVGGFCTAGSGACDDPNASCTNSKCVCNFGYQIKLADATCSGAIGLVVSAFLLCSMLTVQTSGALTK